MADKAVSLRGEQTVLFTNRQLVALMWPLLLEQFLAITVGLADSLMVATVGDAAISAVSLVDSISNLMIYIFSAMATGGAAVAGQYIGQRQKEDACHAGQQLIALLAVVSVALGMAVMILAMAVIMGFKREVARKMTGFAAHVAVTDIRGVNALDAQPVRRSAHVEELIRRTDGFVAMAPYAVKGGIVRTADAVGEVMLKGVEADYDWSYFREWLVAGELPRVGGEVRTKDILLSRSLADRLMLGVGDRVEMLFVEAGDTPRRDRFKVAGIYSSGMDEMDNTVILTDLRNVQRLSDWAPDEISGYEVFTDDLAGADDFARRLGHTLLYDEDDATANLAVTSVTELYASIFDWLKAHDVNAAVIIVIMLVVAFFNMTSALLILVLERTRMIGLLKAFGMRNGQLRQVFLWRASFITLRGLAWGNAVGLGLCFVQRYFHVVRLSSEGYLLSEVPISLGWGWWLALNAGAVAAIVALLVVPTYIVSTVKPDESIRYE